ncbi:delta-like protein A isoform X2 [Lineus longissimus]|uniref:delta-like protein A isoform X2 n=1 Tax=Lineus longissimus TaxID=88925 RepID=UPI00315D29C3
MRNISNSVFCTIVVFLACVFCLVQLSDGGATMQIRFLTYNNPGGKGSNGHCCDGKSIFCFSACDHKFTVCLDHSYSRSSDPYYCPNGKIQTDRVHDRNYITFGTWFGKERNPMVYKFPMWPGSVKLKVRIVDYDPVGPPDHVDDLARVISVRAAKSFHHAAATEYVVRHRTTLKFWVKVFCDPYYYGDACTIYCSDRDDESGHFKCNIETGEKICIAGWTGEDCNIPIDECGSSPCLNGGLCEDKHNSYHCICPRGFLGNHCEGDFNECGSDPCRNGGVCVDGVDSYECLCDSGYTGTNCQTEIMPCTYSPCQNNGTCINLNKTHSQNYSCDCLDGFIGYDCEDVYVPTTTTTTTVETTIRSTAPPTTVRITTQKTIPTATIDGRDMFAMSVMVNGRLNDSDLKIIKDWLMAKIMETELMDVKTMHFGIDVQECHGEKGPVTELYIGIKYDPTDLTPDEIKFVMRHVGRSLKTDFPYDKYQGKECKAVRVAAITTEHDKTWFEKNWALLFSAVGGSVLIILVIVGVFISRRRRRRKQSEEQLEERHEDTSEEVETYDSIEEDVPPLPPRKYSTAEHNATQAFGNAIYFDQESQPSTTSTAREGDVESLYERIDDEEC